MDFPPQRLPETGSVPSQAPLLVLWGARALYLGPGLRLSAHRSAVAVLAVGLEAPFGVARHPGDPSAGDWPCRAALIGPNSLHHLRTAGPMAFFYLDPLSRDYAAVLAKAARRQSGVAFDLGGEPALAVALTRLFRGDSN